PCGTAFCCRFATAPTDPIWRASPEANAAPPAARNTRHASGRRDNRAAFLLSWRGAWWRSFSLLPRSGEGTPHSKSLYDDPQTSTPYPEVLARQREPRRMQAEVPGPASFEARCARTSGWRPLHG